MNQPTNHDERQTERIDEMLRKALGAQRAGIVAYLRTAAEDHACVRPAQLALENAAAMIQANADLRPLEKVNGCDHGRD